MSRSWLLAGVAALSLGAAAGAQTAKPHAPSGPERFTVPSDGHPLAVWARRPATPKGTILLVHGRTWSSRPDFDLQVPGMQRSVMTSLAAQGFAAYAVDLRGYGETPRDATGWMTPKRAAADLVNVLNWIAERHPTLPKPTLVGWSRGAGLAGIAAVTAPTRMSALVLFGFAFDPDLQFGDLAVPEKPLMEKNTPEAAASDFVSPKVISPAVIQAFVEQALKADPILVDLKNDVEFNLFKPAKLMVPTLVLFGDRDAGVPQEDAGKFFARIAAPDKQMVVLPGGDHAAQLEDTHEAWIAAIINFINRPPVRRAPATRAVAQDPDPAPGTFSILGFDPETGEIGGAVESCVFSAGSGPLWAEAGVGAVVTQAIVDVSYGPQGLELLRKGMAPNQIIKTIWERDPDPRPATGPTQNQRGWTKQGRQFAVITGPRADPWAGDKQGKFCTAQGNILAGPDVVSNMVAAFESSEKTASGQRQHISMRLVAALEAGQAAGGDTRCQQSAALLVVKKDGGPWLHNDVVLRLQVDDNPQPIAELRRLVEKAPPNRGRARGGVR
jgi:uncharacterized Ntn-hydrolase superfamily protein/pimeloyl-ACP methyl ester carboxylesterase